MLGGVQIPGHVAGIAPVSVYMQRLESNDDPRHQPQRGVVAMQVEYEEDRLWQGSVRDEKPRVLLQRPDVPASQ